MRKPDGGTRPITVPATAYRIWASRTAQILADWTSWFPDELVGGRPHGARATDSANHISAVLADKHATNIFLAGVCLDVSKCFDSISLQGVRLLLDSIGAPAFLYNAVNFWHSLQRHVWFEAKPTGVVIQSHLPRGIPQGDPIAPWCLNLIIATWICNLPPLQTVKLFLDDMITTHKPEQNIVCEMQPFPSPTFLLGTNILNPTGLVGNQPRCTSKSGWVTHHADISFARRGPTGSSDNQRGFYITKTNS